MCACDYPKPSAWRYTINWLHALFNSSFNISHGWWHLIRVSIGVKFTTKKEWGRPFSHLFLFWFYFVCLFFNLGVGSLSWSPSTLLLKWFGCLSTVPAPSTAGQAFLDKMWDSGERHVTQDLNSLTFLPCLKLESPILEGVLMVVDDALPQLIAEAVL